MMKLLCYYLIHRLKKSTKTFKNKSLRYLFLPIMRIKARIINLQKYQVISQCNTWKTRREWAISVLSIAFHCTSLHRIKLFNLSITLLRIYNRRVLCKHKLTPTLILTDTRTISRSLSMVGKLIDYYYVNYYNHLLFYVFCLFPNIDFARSSNFSLPDSYCLSSMTISGYGWSPPAALTLLSASRSSISSKSIIGSFPI